MKKLVIILLVAGLTVANSLDAAGQKRKADGTHADTPARQSRRLAGLAPVEAVGLQNLVGNATAIEEDVVAAPTAIVAAPIVPPSPDIRLVHFRNQIETTPAYFEPLNHVDNKIAQGYTAAQAAFANPRATAHQAVTAICRSVSATGSALAHPANTLHDAINAAPNAILDAGQATINVATTVGGTIVAVTGYLSIMGHMAMTKAKPVLHYTVDKTAAASAGVASVIHAAAGRIAQWWRSRNVSA